MSSGQTLTNYSSSGYATSQHKDSLYVNIETDEYNRKLTKKEFMEKYGYLKGLPQTPYSKPYDCMYHSPWFSFIEANPNYP